VSSQLSASQPSTMPSFFNSENLFICPDSELEQMLANVTMVQKHKSEANRLNHELTEHLSKEMVNFVKTSKFMESSKYSSKPINNLMEKFGLICQEIAESEKHTCWFLIQKMYSAWINFLKSNPSYTPKMDGCTHKVLVIIYEIGVVSCCIEQYDNETKEHCASFRLLMQRISNAKCF